MPTNIAYTWTGAASDDWSNGANWAGGAGGIPGAGDFVTIPGGTARDCVLRTDGTTSIATLTLTSVGTTGALLIGSTDPNTTVILNVSGKTADDGAITLGETTGGGIGELETGSMTVGSGATPGTVNIGNPADSGNPGELVDSSSLIGTGSSTIIVGGAGTSGSKGTLDTQTLTAPSIFTDNINGDASTNGSTFLTGISTIAGTFDAQSITPAILSGSGVIDNTGTTKGSYTFSTGGWSVYSNGSIQGNLGAGSYVVRSKLTINGMLYPVGDVTLSGGTFTGPGGLNFMHNLTVNSGTFSDAGGTTVQSPATFDTGTGGMTVSSAFTDDGAVTDMGVNGTGTLAIGSGVTVLVTNCLNAKIDLASITSGGGPPPPGVFENGGNDTMNIQSPTNAPLSITSDFSNVGTLDIADGAAATISNVNSGTHDLSGTLTCAGDLTLLGAITATQGLLQQAGVGTLYIGSGSTFGSLTAQQIIEYGNIEVEGSGTLSTTGALTQISAAKLTLDIGSTTSLASFTQDSGGDLVIEASSPVMYATLRVTGDASLSSQLEFEYVGGYMPTNGTAFTVVTAGTLSGKFSTVPQYYDMTYTGTSAIATYDDNNS